MTWSYDVDAAASSAKSKVRLLIGDTSVEDQLLQDEEIEALISIEGNVFKAAAQASESIAGKFARRADQTVGELKISFKNVAKTYMMQAKSLRSRATASGAQVYAGGISVSDVEAVKQDTDQVRGRIDIGLTDYPGFPKTPNVSPTTEAG